MTQEIDQNKREAWDVEALWRLAGSQFIKNGDADLAANLARLAEAQDPTHGSDPFFVKPVRVVKAVDISNFTGNITPAEVAALRAAGVEYVIVRLSWENSQIAAITATQIAALEADGQMPYGGYFFADWGQDATLMVKQFLATYPNLKSLWWDGETNGPHEVLPGGAAVNAWVYAAMSACPVPHGVYGNANSFSEVAYELRPDDALWLAGVPSLDGANLGGHAAVGVQMPGQQQIAGLTVDVDEFEASALGLT